MLVYMLKDLLIANGVLLNAQISEESQWVGRKRGLILTQQPNHTVPPREEGMMTDGGCVSDLL